MIPPLRGGRHTGVMWMQRQGAGPDCMQRWREILLSGKYSTDQQSLDEAEALGETFLFPSECNNWQSHVGFGLRILPQRPQLSDEAPAIRQGLYRHGIDLWTDLCPRDCGGSAGRH